MLGRRGCDPPTPAADLVLAFIGFHIVAFIGIELWLLGSWLRWRWTLGAQARLGPTGVLKMLVRETQAVYVIASWYVRALGRSGVAEAAVLPVRISGRVVNLLYVDNADHAMAESSFAALSGVCSCVAAAYERLILNIKKAEREG